MTAAAPEGLVLDLLRHHGRNLHSFMVLEPGLSWWTSDAGDAAVAYVVRGGCWLAAGGPLCAPEQTLDVARAFAAAAGRSGKSAAFFGVSDRFLARLAGAPEFDALPIGLAPLWNPSGWTAGLRKAEKLRNRLKRGARAGVTVRMADPEEVGAEPLHSAMIALVDRWSEGRDLPPMGFMTTLELFGHAALRRYFLAEHEGALVGFAVAVPIYGRQGWLVEDLVLARTAPSGTSELLVDAAMRRFADEGAEVASLGMVALAGLDRTPSAHPRLVRLLATCSRRLAWLYDFDGLYRFRNKMKPTVWEPVYLVAAGRVTGWTLRAVLMAFAEGWVPAYALRAVGRWLRHRLVGSRR